MFPTLGTDWPSEKVAELGWPWTCVQFVDSTGSTNADLADAARRGAESGTVLIAAHQSEGRGRLDRRWEAPPGAAWAISVLLRPPASIPVSRWMWLPLLAGMAVTDALNDSVKVPAAVKWPNDVVLDERSSAPGKICGILAERIGPVGDLPAAVVVGMGVNARLTADNLPVPTATSLALAGVTFDDGAVIEAVLSALSQRYRQWLDGEDLQAELRSRCVTLGRQVRVHVAGSADVIGEAIDVDVDGRLMVRVGPHVKTFAAGDVVHLR